MSKHQMTIHRALAELKLLTSKIEKSITFDTFSASYKESTKKVNGVDVKDFSKEIMSSKQSIEKLIVNRKRIKSAIIKSNANTIVKIGNEEMTVADAIERKQSIHLEKEFLQTLKSSINLSTNKAQQENNAVNSKLEGFLSSVIGDKGSRDPETVKQHSDAFMAANQWVILDPIGINQYVKEKETAIEEFETNVDYVLSESNSTTFIEIELAD